MEWDSDYLRTIINGYTHLASAPCTYIDSNEILARIKCNKDTPTLPARELISFSLKHAFLHQDICSPILTSSSAQHVKRQPTKQVIISGRYSSGFYIIAHRNVSCALGHPILSLSDRRPWVGGLLTTRIWIRYLLFSKIRYLCLFWSWSLFPSTALNEKVRSRRPRCRSVTDNLSAEHFKSVSLIWPHSLIHFYQMSWRLTDVWGRWIYPLDSLMRVWQIWGTWGSSQIPIWCPKVGASRPNAGSYPDSLKIYTSGSLIRRFRRHPRSSTKLQNDCERHPKTRYSQHFQHFYINNLWTLGHQPKKYFYIGSCGCEIRIYRNRRNVVQTRSAENLALQSINKWSESCYLANIWHMMRIIIVLTIVVILIMIASKYMYKK